MPSDEDGGDLESARAALGCPNPSGPVRLPPPLAFSTEPTQRGPRSNRRAVLGLLLVGLLVGGVIALLTSSPDTRDSPSAGSRASVVFGNAESGTCLSWPPDSPDKPSFVQCREDHMFEVAKSVEMSNFGEPCQAAVRQYLGPKYDPNSRFTISVLWAGDAAGTQSGGRNLLCGLQLIGLDSKPVPFKGAVAELDQSKVWPAGTCLGLDAATNRSTDVPVDCAAAHAVEVAGSVNLADRFPGAAPAEADQDAFLRDECTRATEAYLAPVPLQATGLVLNYTTLAQSSWSAGSRQVSCGLVSPGEQGLRPLVGTVKGPTAGDQAVVAPPPAPPALEPPPPPPVYGEPLDAVPSEAPPSPAPTAAIPEPPPLEPPPPPAEVPPPPAEVAPELGPPPGPATPPSEGAGPDPGIVEIPGLPPITLPGYVPPPPPPPAPPPPA